MLEHTGSDGLGVNLVGRRPGRIERELSITELECSVILVPELAAGVLILQIGEDFALSRVESLAVDHAIGADGLELECSGGGRAGSGKKSDADVELHCCGWRWLE